MAPIKPMISGEQPGAPRRETRRSGTGFGGVVAMGRSFPQVRGLQESLGEHRYIYTCLHMYIHVYVYTCTRTEWVFTYPYIYTYVRVYRYKHICLCTHALGHRFRIPTQQWSPKNPTNKMIQRAAWLQKPGFALCGKP